jgi:hypothetical protein
LSLLYRHVRAWVEEGLVTAVLPTHEVRRAAVGPSDLEHLAHPLGTAAVIPGDNEPISDSGVHGHASFVFDELSGVIGAGG